MNSSSLYTNNPTISEQKSNRMCHKVSRWVSRTNRIPSRANNCSNTEKEYARWLARKINAKNNGGEYKLYKSDLLIAKQYDVEYILDIGLRESISNKMTRQVCEWILANDMKLPRKYEMYNNLINKKGIKRVTKRENILGTWLGARRCKELKIYESDRIIVEEYGLGDIFTSKKIKWEKDSNRTCKNVCNWVIRNGRIPIRSSKNKLERKYARWLLAKQMSLSGHGTAKFYESDINIVKKKGLLDKLGFPEIIN